MITRILTLIFSILLTACAASGPIYQAAPPPAENHARVYIYRVNTFAAGGRDAYFYVDKKNIADLSVEGYTWFHVPAGEHTFRQKWPADIGTSSVAINLWRWSRQGDSDAVNAKNLQEGYVNWEAGKTYYYRFHTNTYGLLGMQWILQEVTAEQALPEIKKNKLQASFNK
ncbi:DUF2846 domain-containing protein [Undibacterium sp. TC4M20W]|uniref:DUF2846 domain-containing protein n=1 Tax=Undibacterium sp. TC4M20W TaxID=3413052 RepID=UPI003BF34A9E